MTSIQWPDYRPHAWFMTGHHAHLDAGRDTALGVCGALLKPFGRRELRRLVNDVPTFIEGIDAARTEEDQTA